MPLILKLINCVLQKEVGNQIIYLDIILVALINWCDL